MAIQRHLRKVGAHPNQDTGRKRKRRTLSPRHQDSQPKKHTQPSKRQRKSESSPQRAQRLVWEKPSPLCRSTLKEFDHRNALLAKEALQQVGQGKNQVCPATVQEFARDGGPDLSGLRQYPEDSTAIEPSNAMTSRSGRPSNSMGTGLSRRSSAYDSSFADHLHDGGISLPSRRHRAANHSEWNEVLIQPRQSLSPSRMSDGHYHRFVDAAEDAITEADVRQDVMPFLRTRNPSRRDVKFTNLEPVARGVVVPQPDYYEGEAIGPGTRQLRAQLNSYIVPSKNAYNKVFLPNFFTEVKGPEGVFGVAQRQAAHDGAVGARGMHRTENHGRRREKFDNKARTASAVLHGAGHLDIFSHHLSKPTQRGGPPQTYMTPLRSYSLTDSPETYRQGLGAYRNASDYAQHHRTESIKNAHRRSKIISPRPLPISPRSTLTPLSCQNQSSGSDTDSSSEAEDSDGSDHRASSRGRAKDKTLKGKTLKPKVVFASPQRPAKRNSSPPRRELRPRRPRR